MGRKKACGEHLGHFVHLLSHPSVMHVGSADLAMHGAVDSMAAIGNLDRWDAVYRRAVLP